MPTGSEHVLHVLCISFIHLTFYTLFSLSRSSVPTFILMLGLAHCIRLFFKKTVHTLVYWSLILSREITYQCVAKYLNMNTIHIVSRKYSFKISEGNASKSWIKMFICYWYWRMTMNFKFTNRLLMQWRITNSIIDILKPPSRISRSIFSHVWLNPTTEKCY